MSLPALPEPHFIDRDPAAITAQMVAQYEADAGKALHDAQVERLLVNNIAYRETLVRIGIQEAAKQTLLYYAGSPMLDYIAQFYGVERLAAQPAQTTLRFALPAPALVDTPIPLGSRVSNGSLSLVFATSAPALVAAGQSAVDVQAVCETAGVVGNGWPTSESGILLDDLGVAGVLVTTLAASGGGADQEGQERFRQRVADAPESFTTAGSRAAYRWHAMSVSQTITAVGVVMPVPGVVRLHVLVDAGLPSADLLDAVAAKLTGETVRPLCDTVQVMPPVEVAYTFSLALTLYIGADAPTLLAQVQAAAAAYQAAQAASLGRDIVKWQIEALATLPGVYSASAICSLPDQALDDSQWAHCTGFTVSIAGYEGG